MTIGEKIKELRKKNDLTQEKMADFLCVSSQAVSKWECGLACPDLSLIGPLTKLLHVSADELLGLNPAENDTKEQQLRDAYNATFRTGNIADRLQIASEAIREYPGNMKWLKDYAWDVWCYAIEYISEDDAFERERDKAIKLFETVIENTQEDDIKAHAIEGIVQCLCGKGNKKEAMKYAEIFPEAKVDPSRKTYVMGLCLEGDEQLRLYQSCLHSILDDLLHMLTWSYVGDADACSEAAEKILTALITDGNYLRFSHDMYSVCLRKAESAMKNGDNSTALEYIRKAARHAAEYDRIIMKEPGEYTYTAPLFDHYTFDTRQSWLTGEGTLTDDYNEFIKRPIFDPIREKF